MAEFLGTGILTFVVLDIGRSIISNPYFIAFGAGFAIVMIGIALANDVQLNPAYTFALWTARKIKTTRAIAYIAVQLLGGWAAYALYKYFMRNMPMQGAPHAYEARILVSEVVGAFVFSFVAAGALYKKAHWAVRGAVLGAAYTMGVIIASVGLTGFDFINPAIALGSNSWVWGTYVLGPVLGAIIGVNLYGLMFAPAKVSVKAAAVAVKASTKKAKK